MLPICHICLRTDRKLQPPEESLSNWHDELCEFAIDDFVQLCSECMYMLRKFQEFKKKCLRAMKVLQNWKKQIREVRPPLDLLKEQIPSRLARCNKKNHKVCFYGLDTAQNPAIQPDLTAQIPSGYSIETLALPNYNHTFTINIGSDTNSSHICNNDTETIKEAEVKLEREIENEHYKETIVFEELHVKDDIDSNKGNLSENESDSSDFYISQFLNDSGLNVDSSDDEILKPKKPRKSSGAVSDDSDEKPLKKPKRVRNKKPLNIELLKKNLLTKFAKYGDVKDEEGNPIDKECILNSLDKMHIYTLNQVKNRCLGTKPFTPEAIQVLSRVQKRYGDQYSSVFTIEHLPTKEDVMAEFEKRQYYEGYISSEHKCTFCYRGFKHKKLLEYHDKMYHDPSLPHFCPICQMRFKSRHALLKHRNGHRAVYKCKLCPLVTNYRTAMVNHYNQHKGVVYMCKHCKGTFKSKSCLSAHMNYVHQSQYICSLCARTFASEIGLSQHRNRKHQNEVLKESPDSKKCEQCDIEFVSEEVYQKHLEKSHAETKPHGYVYKKRKIVAPRQKPNFICRVCKEVVHSIGRLTWHFEREHPTENYELIYSDVRKYLCHICGKGYASITDLNEHKHLHTGAKPYACDKCPKAFHRKINLRNHLERHLPPARECPQCGKKFVSAANLNNHIKMHIGIRHHSCEICSKSFLHRSSLNAHVRGVHHHIRRARKQNGKTAAE